MRKVIEGGIWISKDKPSERHPFYMTEDNFGNVVEVKYKQNAELIAKILNDDENGVSSVYKAWEQYRGVDVL